MKIYRPFIAILILLLMTIGADAKKKMQEYPRAEINVSYNYHEKFMRGNVEYAEHDVPMLLLANSTQSKFYSPHTEYKDSLESTSSGRAMSDKILTQAVKHALATGDQSLVDNFAYKTRMYVFKNYPDSVLTVFDSYMFEQDFHMEPFSEIEWSIVEDSTKSVLGYECRMATAKYHGRRWTAWFAPEIPVCDGPWKLRGLPGLILEATEEKGHHSFIADGIETSDQPIRPVYDSSKYEKMERINMLRSLRHYRDNKLSIAKASTDGMLDLGTDAPPQKEYDFLETDYR